MIRTTVVAGLAAVGLLLLAWFFVGRRAVGPPPSPQASGVEAGELTGPAAPLMGNGRHALTPVDRADEPSGGRVVVRGTVVGEYAIARLAALSLIVGRPNAEGVHAGLTVAVSPDGTWEASLPPGIWLVGSAMAGCDIVLSLSPEQITVEEDSGPFELTLDANLIIDGVVVDCLGNPVPGVGVSGGGCNTVTDAQGRFLLPARASSGIELSVDEESLPPDLLPPWWQSLASHEIVGEEPGFTGSAPAILELPTMHVLHGVARDANRVPLADVTLSIRGRFNEDAPGAQGPNHVVQTGSGGEFSVDGIAPGPYEVWLFGQNPRPDAETFVVECVFGGDTLDLVFDGGLGSARLEGRVIDSNGNPVSGMAFGVWRKSPGLTRSNRMTFPSKATMWSDATGSASAQGLPAGRYLIVRRQSAKQDPGLIYLDAERSQEVEVTDGEMATFIWVVDPVEPARLSAELAASDDVPPGPVTLRLEIVSIQEAPIVREITGRANEFRAEDLPPGQAFASLLVTIGGEEVSVNLTPQSLSLVSGEETRVVLELRR